MAAGQDTVEQEVDQVVVVQQEVGQVEAVPLEVDQQEIELEVDQVEAGQQEVGRKVVEKEAEAEADLLEVEQEVCLA